VTPLVSILIPAYNAAEWLDECIESALAQTWDRKEIIVVDDGSTDRTLAIANRYVSKGVQVISQANQGAAGARNTALSVYQGDYIQWLDADDLLAPDKIEKQLRRALSDGSRRTLLSGPWGTFHYRVDKAMFRPTALWCDLTPVEWLTRKMEQNLHMQPDSWLVSRELTTLAGPWDTSLWRDNDGEYFARLILEADNILFVANARSYYRLAGFSSVTYVGKSSKKLDSLYKSLTLHIRYLLAKEDTPRTRAACVVYLQNWLLSFYPYRADLVTRSKELANRLGGALSEPRLSWKYAWIRRLFGWSLAREAQLFLPKIKWAVLISADRALHLLERRSSGQS
jgi:glycosyltransferase involved in cell wall biosynthesis